MSQPTLPAVLQKEIANCRKLYWYTATCLAHSKIYSDHLYYDLQKDVLEDACTFQKLFRNKRSAIISRAGTHTDAVLDAFEQLPKLPSPQKLLIDLKLGGAA